MEKMRRNKTRRSVPPAASALPPTPPPIQTKEKKPLPPPQKPKSPAPQNDFFDFDLPAPPKQARPAFEMKQVAVPAPSERRAAPSRPKPGRRYRITKREMQRRRRKRTLVLLLVLLVAILAGVILSMNVLFKVKNFRIETFDGEGEASTGIYTQEQIVAALGIEPDSNLFAFRTGSRASALLAQLPYLDRVEVHRSLPDTVVIRIEPAVERYSVKTQQGWATLSTGFRVLTMTDHRNTDLIFLKANNVQADAVGGSIWIIDNTEVAPAQEADLAESTNTAPTPEPAENDRFTDLTYLTWRLETEKLLDKVTQIDIRDITEITVVYDDRITMDIGTANNLDYKLEMAGYILRNENGDGLSDTDRGSLDVSHVKSDGTIDAVFSPQ